MSLHTTHLNADSSFFLIFSPPFAPSNSPPGSFPGSFTILLDPWLTGSCTILNKHFAQTIHTTPSSVDSINDLPCEPDLIVISQDKPDHCHRETLRELSPESPALILGTSAAAKKIKSWNHFYPENVEAMKRFDERKEDTLYRIRIPPLSDNGSAGEVTVALLAPKRDLTGLHNGIGFTYRPPSSPLSLKTGSAINLPRSPSSTTLPISAPTPINIFPPSPPETPPLPSRPSTSSGKRLRSRSRSRSTSSRRPSTSGSGSSRSRLNGISNISSSTLNLTHATNPLGLIREKTLSILYSPHGVPFKCVEPYASSHLLSASALPLTALFHPFDEVANPWYLGGAISHGSPGGLEIARRLFAKVWVGAHDEEKVNTGVGTRGTRVKKWHIDDVRRLLEEAPREEERRRKRASSNTTRSASTSGSGGKGLKGGRTQSEVMTLNAGDEVWINGDGVTKGRSDVGVAV
ncbi:MAG: hypothetical protein Q9162_003788 [Coniocarpon cinnabarinum]